MQKRDNTDWSRIPLTLWDVARLFGSYIQRGLLFAQAPLPTA